MKEGKIWWLKKKVKWCGFYKEVELLNERDGKMIGNWLWDVNRILIVILVFKVLEKELFLEGIE